MKSLIKTISAAAIIMLMPVAVHAEVGDIAGEIYSTDILTQFNGLPIRSYAIDGETLIALEDLEDYGFNVKYDDSIRTVFINKLGEPAEDFEPQIERGKVGEIAGYYYETDIIAYLNGINIRAYAIDGQMVARVEDIGAVREDSEYGISVYGMTYTWDEENRLLSLNYSADKRPDITRIKEDFMNRDSFGWFYSEEIPCESGSVLIGGSSGTTHGTYMYYYYLRNSDRLFVPLDGILNSYGFHDIWGHLRVDNLRCEGDFLIFDGTKYDGRKGTYKLDLNKYEMSVVGNESEPDESRASHMTYIEPPAAKPVTTSYIKVTIDGVQIPAFYCEGYNRTFIYADVLEDFGFVKTESAGYLVSYVNTGEKKQDISYDIRPSGESAGVFDISGKSVYVNGRSLTSYSHNGKLVIDADELCEYVYDIGTVGYDLCEPFGLVRYGMSGEYDDSIRTLMLATPARQPDKYEEIKANAKTVSGKYEGMTSTVLADNDEYFVITYTMGNDVECYLIRSTGTIYSLHEIGAWYMSEPPKIFRLEGTRLTVWNRENNGVWLDINTLALAE